MSYDGFLLAVKSTIDKRGNDIALAQSPSALFLDLDDITSTEEVNASRNDAVVWELGTFEDSPHDPLYILTFSIGARTTDDAANYDIMRLVGKVKEGFQIGTRLPIKDYSGTVASAEVGVLLVTDVTVMHQAFDRISGMRLAMVTARAQRAV